MFVRWRPLAGDRRRRAQSGDQLEGPSPVDGVGPVGHAHGLRPSCLDDSLGPALESLSRSSALPLHVSYSGGDLPDHVSVTAYYVASEGVTNAVKHSGARRVALDVRRADDGLHVAVHDDGAGGARIAGGTGLAMLHDRVRALGGRLSVTDRQPAGTSLVAVIPCGS
jgi:signal transduction histidine kinase